MGILAVVMALAIVGVPPLTADQQGLLETAFDGRDHQEPAFQSLLDNTSLWDGELGDASIRLNPDFEAMLKEPDSYRGELCRIAGRLEKIEALFKPYEGIDAWFVRVESGLPVLVYVDFRKSADAEQGRFKEGKRVTVTARFYKRVDADVDDKIHSYAAFVGAYPKLSGAGAAGNVDSSILPIMAVLIAVLGAAFLIVFIYVRRQSRRISNVRHRGGLDPMDIKEDTVNLPEDPADALVELKKRAENEN